jgi:eukaryotic-like serine/threonine-protein kinase
MRGDMTMDFSGYQFRHYRLKRLQGEGDCAHVYKAWDTNLRRWVAIKVLHNYVTPEQREAFLEEGRVMASMNHCHILPVLECDTYGSIPYLVLPFVPHSLSSLYPHGTIVPSDKIISYVWQIALALFYIHQRGYIHQDVKPAHVLLGEGAGSIPMICKTFCGAHVRPVPSSISNTLTS